MRAFLFALILVLPCVASAQDGPRLAAHAHVLDTIHISGSPPTPITVFIPRAHVRFDSAGADHHAVDRIVESVRHSPF